MSVTCVNLGRGNSRLVLASHSVGLHFVVDASGQGRSRIDDETRAPIKIPPNYMPKPPHTTVLLCLREVPTARPIRDSYGCGRWNIQLYIDCSGQAHKAARGQLCAGSMVCADARHLTDSTVFLPESSARSA